MNTLGGDNKQQSTPVEIYRRIRNDALEDAAATCDKEPNKYAAAKAIRALKREEA